MSFQRMRLQIVSDLHFEADPAWQLPAVDADVLVVAGDAGPGVEGLRKLASRKNTSMPVLYVPGNHEYYGGEITAGAESLEIEAAASGVILLNRKEIVIGGVRFIGATLWTDFALYGIGAAVDKACKAARGQILDYEHIWMGERLLTPEDTITLHERDRVWLTRALDTEFDGPTVVVTHHAPHPKSVHPRWVGHPCTPGFTSDLSHLMDGVDFWVHGHMHESFDYRVGSTRVICNPKGYGRENPAFNPSLTVDAIAPVFESATAK